MPFLRNLAVPLVLAILSVVVFAPPAVSAVVSKAPTDGVSERGTPLALPGTPRPPGAARTVARAAPALPGTLAELLTAFAADSLVEPLRRFEAANGRTGEGADAAFTLGQIHYARGEYRQAGEAYARAAARFSPERKSEARYWQGLSALGQGDPVQARAALEEIAAGESPRRSEARFAVAEAWEKAGRADRAVEVLRDLLADHPGSVEAPALERLAALSEHLGDPEGARRAAAQLREAHPRSIEATRLPPPIAPPLKPVTVARPEKGGVGVQIGAFNDPERARLLLDSARRAGFSRAQTLNQGQGAATLHVVRIGWFANEADARTMGERASRELGVAYRLIRTP